MIGRRAFPATIAAVLGLVAAQAPADARGDYEMLFGKEDKAVTATKSALDDAAFAGKLLEAAKSLRDSPEVQILMWERAHELGCKHPTGHATALEAIELLRRSFPDRAAKQAEWQARQLAALEIRYRHGPAKDRRAAGEAYLGALLDLAETASAADKLAESRELLRKAYPIARYAKSPLRKEILAEIKWIGRKLSAAPRRQAALKRLKDALHRAPANASARRDLILHYIVEIGDAAAALRLLTSDVDERLRGHIRLAATKVGELSEADNMALGDWYKLLAAKAGALARPRLLSLAKMHYERFLALHDKQDLAAMKAEMPLKEVTAALDATAIVPHGIPKPVRQAMLLTRRLNDLAYWEVKGGTWGQVKGQLVGQGDGAMSFRGRLPADGVLEFSLHVVKGMRPRVHFREFYLGNEGFQREFGFHGGASNRSGGYSPYDGATVMRVRLAMRGRNLELRINGRPLAKAKRPSVDYETLQISCGDDYSKGTTKYWGFRLTPWVEEAAAK